MGGWSPNPKWPPSTSAASLFRQLRSIMYQEQSTEQSMPCQIAPGGVVSFYLLVVSSSGTINLSDRSMPERVMLACYWGMGKQSFFVYQ